ncbi:hypothetical protein TorRG33x02_289100 [Trema orientale]|uniref:Uncharacterized protein n=1 Tax=Trema orientale TaxID=63057 RepID=A0A2P5CDL3_TREOI|nr:hypothetical protein TorRG33x02_289100 [Trema orientale]
MLKIHAPHSYNKPNHRQKPILFPTLTLALYYLTWPEFSTRTVAVFDGKIFSDRLKKKKRKRKEGKYFRFKLFDQIPTKFNKHHPKLFLQV